MNKTQEQIMSMLDYLKESGVPCEVTVFYEDYPNPLVKLRIDLSDQTDKQMMDVFKKKTGHYSIMITIGNMNFGNIYKNRIRTNQKTFEEIKWYIRKKSGESITKSNWNIRMGEILSDPTLEPLV